MSRRFSAIGAAGLLVSVLAFAGCSGTDPTPAADALSEQYTLDLRTGLVQELGFTRAEVENAEITVSCPESVTEGEPFDCTVTGSPGGESKTIEMAVEGETMDASDPASGQAAVDEVFISVAEALGA